MMDGITQLFFHKISIRILFPKSKVFRDMLPKNKRPKPHRAKPEIKIQHRLIYNLYYYLLPPNGIYK